jgi:hypothetical protein
MPATAYWAVQLQCLRQPCALLHEQLEATAVPIVTTRLCARDALISVDVAQGMLSGVTRRCRLQRLCWLDPKTATWHSTCSGKE